MRFALFLLVVLPLLSGAQNRTDSFRYRGDVLVTIDWPEKINTTGASLIIFYALPNGNSTAQTMGKSPAPGNDWRFDIQHISAQTRFIRKSVPSKNVIVVYLENDSRSWPTWRKIHSDAKPRIRTLVDSLYALIPGKQKVVCLNGHSGGGSFILGYIDAVDVLPRYIERIAFLDSNYGYDSTLHLKKIREWLQHEKHFLTVFAYNDSVALYNGKPVVSPTGGTWYRSHQMLKDLKTFKFNKTRNDSLVIYRSKNKRIGFFFKTNPLQKIYHTHQVELNGFIHSILFGTKKESKGYHYYGTRAYKDFIK